MKLVQIGKVKPNPKNPRIIKDDKFQKLVASLQEFPEMASVRPIVCNTDMVILGGNMRFKAMMAAGWKEVPVEIVDWPEDKQAEFVIKDNVSGGEWDWDALANEWSDAKLDEWGLDVWHPSPDVDYSILDDDLDGQLEDMADGVKKAIQIEFEPQHYDEAYAVVKFWRERGSYVGSMILNFLKSEKDKL